MSEERANRPDGPDPSGHNRGGPVANVAHDLTLDSALEQMMLDAQLVAHAQKHGREAFLESEQRAELRAIIDDIGKVTARDGTGTLRMLGVMLEAKRGELTFRKGGSVLIVRAGVDGVVEVGDHAVRPDEPFYSDALYRSVQALIVEWATAVAGDEKSLWSVKN